MYHSLSLYLSRFQITREEYLDFSGIGDGRLYNRNPSLRFGTIAGGNTEAVLSTNKANLYNYMQKFNKSSSEEGKFSYPSIYRNVVT